jgi:hypothetical protein
MSQPSAANVGPPTSNRAFFLQYVSIVEGADGKKRQKCSLCKDHTWSIKTSMDIVQDHCESLHRHVWKNRPIVKTTPTLNPIVEAYKSADSIGQFDKVVEAFIRHPKLPISICDSKHFRQLLKCSIKVNRKAVRQGVIDKDLKYFAKLKDLLKGKKVGIMIDGGKAVDGVKIIGVCIVVNGISFCFKMVFVELGEILTAEWYKDMLLAVVLALEALGAIVVSVTMDNEASPNAGMRLLQETKPYIVHNRCYPHTAELLIEDLQSLGTRTHPTLPAVPMIRNVIQKVHDVVTCILNSKYLKAALFNAQKSRMVGSPLTLVKPANTRKWSTGFLMLARFCALYDDIAAIEHFLAAGHRPEQSEVHAKALWLGTQKPLVPNRLHCDAVRELLYWIYVGEQMMQKDSASVIHATNTFEEICCALETDSPTHRVPRLIQNDMDLERVRAIVSERRQLLQSSGIYWLSLCLFPKPTAYTLEHHSDACGELETFITACWPQWQQRNRAELRLPSRYHCQVSDVVACQRTLDQFINDVQAELTEHLIPSSDMITRHQNFFEARSAANLERLMAGERGVKRSRPDEADDGPCSHVHQYWAAVTSKLPLLSMIARLLLACCASEAAVERLFSKEGFIHDCYRNRLGKDILTALVRSCMNRNAFDDVVLPMSELLAGSDSASSDSD